MRQINRRDLLKVGLGALGLTLAGFAVARRAKHYRELEDITDKEEVTLKAGTDYRLGKFIVTYEEVDPSELSNPPRLRVQKYGDIIGSYGLDSNSPIFEKNRYAVVSVSPKELTLKRKQPASKRE